MFSYEHWKQAGTREEQTEFGTPQVRQVMLRVAELLGKKKHHHLDSGCTVSGMETTGTHHQELSSECGQLSCHSAQHILWATPEGNYWGFPSNGEGDKYFLIIFKYFL